MSVPDAAIYAAAWVAEFNRLHGLGVHEQFRVDVAAGKLRQIDLVPAWEAWCADLAVDAAVTAVKMHRNARARWAERTDQELE